MTDLPSLIARAEALARYSERSNATVSKWLFGDANVLKRLQGGGSLTVRTLERARERLEAREKEWGIVSPQQRPAIKRGAGPTREKNRA